MESLFKLELHLFFMKKIILLALVVLFASAVCAQPSQLIDYKEIVAAVSANKELINIGLGQMEIPQILKDLFGNETMIVFVKRTGGSTEKIGIKTVNAKIDDIVYGEFQGPTLHVFISEETILEIAASGGPMDTVLNALETGKITYNGVGLGNTIKFGFINFIQSIGLFLRSLFGG